MAFSALCSIAGAIVSSNKPAKPSVVEQLAQVVHSELNNFFDKLQGAELSGLEGRVKRQKTRLQEMKGKEEQDDENLWNDYDHFMGLLVGDKRHLKFIGRLPSEGGKLTKILLLARNPTAKQVVESVRGSLDLPKMADSVKVEKATEKVSRQTVKLKFNGEKLGEGFRVCHSSL